MGPETGRRERSLTGRLRGLSRLQQVILGAGALGGAVIAIIGAGERVVGLFDGDEEGDEVAEIERVVLRDRNVTREEYCRRHLEGAQRDICLGGPGLDDAGNLFLVSVKTSGYGGECCRLEWTIRQDGTRLPAFSDQLAVRGIGSPVDRDWPIWVPNPGRQGDFQVAFDLYDQNGHTSDMTSEPFTVADPA
jgi:hypothetical protein